MYNLVLDNQLVTSSSNEIEYFEQEKAWKVLRKNWFEWFCDYDQRMIVEYVEPVPPVTDGGPDVVA